MVEVFDMKEFDQSIKRIKDNMGNINYFFQQVEDFISMYSGIKKSHLSPLKKAYFDNEVNDIVKITEYLILADKLKKEKITPEYFISELSEILEENDEQDNFGECDEDDADCIIKLFESEFKETSEEKKKQEEDNKKFRAYILNEVFSAINQKEIKSTWHSNENEYAKIYRLRDPNKKIIIDIEEVQGNKITMNFPAEINMEEVKILLSTLPIKPDLDKYNYFINYINYYSSNLGLYNGWGITNNDKICLNGPDSDKEKRII